jgi:hypothetical protein
MTWQPLMPLGSPPTARYAHTASYLASFSTLLVCRVDGVSACLLICVRYLAVLTEHRSMICTLSEWKARSYSGSRCALHRRCVFAAISFGLPLTHLCLQSTGTVSMPVARYAHTARCDSLTSAVKLSCAHLSSPCSVVGSMVYVYGGTSKTDVLSDLFAFTLDASTSMCSVMKALACF